MYRHKHNIHPSQIQNIFTQITDQYEHNKKQIQAPHINHRRLKGVLDRYIYADPRYWLNLPINLK